MNLKQINILDCTLRDGSYLIDYQFSGADTYLIATLLAEAGIQRIEVGHGLGLDAQHKGKGEAAVSDGEYVRMAADAVKGRSKIGVFYIPGYGEPDSIRKAVDQGLNFIRLGTNITEYKQAFSAIRLAKKLGLEVWSNLMKSYVAKPSEFAKICQIMADEGADIAVLVDSAGGMVTAEIASYLNAAKGKVNCPLGFHGHNNLQLAVANSMAAIESGASYIDSSLRGMGRSSGNTPTEILCALLAREKYDLGGINWQRLIFLAQELIAPMMPRDNGMLPNEIASGISYFHSGFQTLIDTASEQEKVATFATILKLPPESKTNVSQEMAAKAAAAVKQQQQPYSRILTSDFRSLNRVACDTVEELISRLKTIAKKTGYNPIMTLARSRRTKNVHEIRIAPIRTGSGYCVAHLESASSESDRKIFAMASREINNWLIDLPVIIPEGAELQHIRYNDELLLLMAISDFIRLRPGNRIVYLPDHARENRIKLMKQLMEGFVTCSAAEADIGIALGQAAKFTDQDVACIRQKGLLIVAEPDTISPETLSAARKKDLEIYRLDLGEILLGEVTRIFNSKKRLAKDTGRKSIEGVTVIAGGIVGEAGDLIVDSISSPSLILGKADGLGGVLPLNIEDRKKTDRIQRWIVSNYL
jgi:4-hydroxy-2-oxovalerate aldolase